MSPDDYPALLAESHDRPAFSNGDEGYSWVGANCDRCIHDKPARQGNDAQGCPLVLLMLVGRTPAQFIDGPRSPEGLYARETQYICTEFRSEDDPDPNPRPIPTPDGQGELLPRAPFEGHRMFSTLGPADRTVPSARGGVQ